MKPKARRQTVVMAEAAMPTPERLLRAGQAFDIGGDRRSGKIFRMLDTPLEQIMKEGRLSELQYEALRKLRMHWFLGHLAGMARSVDLNRVAAPDRSDGPGERELIHRDAFDLGWRALRELEREMVSGVVLEERSLVSAGSSLYASPYRARQAVLTLLQSAADRLAMAWRHA